MVRDSVRFLAEGRLPWPPSVEDFYPPSLVHGAGFWLTKFTVFIWISVALIVLYFLLAYRSPKLVPSKNQWLAESMYGFVRNQVSKDIIGHEGIRFAPYLTTLFLFVMVNNLWGIIPGVQLATTAHIAFPAVLAILSYLVFNYVGIRKHGFAKYFKTQLVPPGAPGWLMPLLIPLEFMSVFLLRPFTLAVRLFANMFAGHVILLVFTLSGFLLMASNNFLFKGVAIGSWLLALVMTIFEVLVALLQAYVFALLTAVYIEGALAEEH
jgi:F-type H+-transporting ATPase subunit a